MIDDTVQVKRVLSIAQANGEYRFEVELLRQSTKLRVLVSAADLLDFDRFQTATLAQTGFLVMPPCGPGAEGPEHYRRHRRAWCNELQSAAWSRVEPGQSPSAEAGLKSAIPKPKSAELRGQSVFRHG